MELASPCRLQIGQMRGQSMRNQSCWWMKMVFPSPSSLSQLAMITDRFILDDHLYRKMIVSRQRCLVRIPRPVELRGSMAIESKTGSSLEGMLLWKR